MTETSTYTWHELDLLYREKQAAIKEALEAYDRGAPIHPIIERLREVA